MHGSMPVVLQKALQRQRPRKRRDDGHHAARARTPVQAAEAALRCLGGGGREQGGDEQVDAGEGAVQRVSPRICLAARLLRRESPCNLGHRQGSGAPLRLRTGAQAHVGADAPGRPGRLEGAV